MFCVRFRQEIYVKRTGPNTSSGSANCLGCPPNPLQLQASMRRQGSHRRLKLSMNYFLKIKYLPDNPYFDPITNSQLSELFEKSKTDPPFGTRIFSHTFEADIDPTSIDSQFERTPPPWEQNNIMFDTSTSSFKKDQKSETVFFFGKNISSRINDTVHTSKRIQTVQSVSRK